MLGDNFVRGVRHYVGTRYPRLLPRHMKQLSTSARLPRHTVQDIAIPSKQLLSITKSDANFTPLVQKLMSSLQYTDDAKYEKGHTHRSLTNDVNDILQYLARNTPEGSLPSGARSDCALLLVQWYAQEHSKRNQITTGSPSSGHIPITIVNSLLRVWLKHGPPAEKLVDALGVRHDALDVEGANRQGIHYVLHPKKQLDAISNIARRERRIAREQKSATETAPFRYGALRSYLWQQRGGLWLTERSRLDSSERRGSVSALFKGKRGADISLHASADAAELTNTWLTKRGRINSDSDALGGPRKTTQTTNDVSSRAMLLAAPSSVHPLIDLPGSASPTLRLVTSLLREATGTFIYADGVALPSHVHLSPAYLPNNETFQLAVRLSTSPADIHHLTAIASWYKVPFHGPSLSEAVKQLVDLKDGRGAHTLLQNTIASDNLNTFLKRKESFTPTLSQNLPQDEDSEDDTTATPKDVKAFLRTLGTIRHREKHLSDEGREFLSALEERIMKTKELPLSFPVVAPHNKRASIGLAYNSLVSTLRENDQHSEAVLAWVALLDAGLVPSVTTIRAVLSSMQRLDLIPDLYSMVSAIEAMRQEVLSSEVQTGDNAYTAKIRHIYDPEGHVRPDRKNKDTDVSIGAFAHHIHLLTETYSNIVNPANKNGDVPDDLFTQCPNIPKDKLLLGTLEEGRSLVDIMRSTLDVSQEPRASSTDKRVYEKTNALFCHAISAIGEVGDVEYLRLMFLRELSRVVLCQSAVEDGEAPVVFDSSMANTFIQTFSKAGDTKSALEVAKTALLFGAELTPTTFYTLLESCTLKDSMDDAFRILDVQVHAGVLPTEETERILMRCVLGWARDGAVVPAPVATVLDVQTRARATNPELPQIMPASRMSVLTDPALCDDIVDILRGKSAPQRSSRGLLGSSNVAAFTGSDYAVTTTTSATKDVSVVNPLTVAAENARVISTSIVRTTIQNMKSAIEEKMEYLARSTPASLVSQAQSSISQEEPIHHDAAHTLTQNTTNFGPMDTLQVTNNEADDEDYSLPSSVFPPPVASYDHYSNLFFPVSNMMESSLEMLKLTLNEWPVSEVLAMYRPSDDPRHPARKSSKRYATLLAKFNEPELA